MALKSFTLVNVGPVIIWLAIISKKQSLKLISKTIEKHEGSKYLVELSKREKALLPTPPPGMNEVVQSR